MHRRFRFGVVAAYAPSHAAWITTARRVEELGYATLLMPDRANIGSLAPLTALAVAAEATTRLRIGSYVFCNEYRHPVILAREAATLDMLSEGRFELGPGAGERILKLAAREADIITIGSKITAQGLDPSDATLEQKIAWIKEAAGKRFVDLELSQTVYDLVFTDSGTAISHYGERPPIPKQPVNTEQRDRYGFSYIQVYTGQMKNFAPVLARIVGQ